MDKINRRVQRDITKDISVPETRDGGSHWLKQFSDCLNPQPVDTAKFTLENAVFCTYSTMRLRVFNKRKSRQGPATLIVAPVAVQDAGFTDLMSGHSLIELLCETAPGPIYLTDWFSATPEMRYFSIDTYLADLNVAIDDIGGAVDCVGLCQGGWLALLHAARFPQKIRRLVLAGTPVDTSVKSSPMSRHALTLVQGHDELPGDCVINAGQWLARLGTTQGFERAAMDSLQRNPGSFTKADMRAVSRYEDWARRSIDLPGRYCREMLSGLFAGNRIAQGTCTALGRVIDLKTVRIPLFVLCGAFDEITPKEQALAVHNLVGTAKGRMRSLVAPCGHFALFVGAGTLSREWRTIASWLSSKAPLAKNRALKG